MADATDEGEWITTEAVIERDSVPSPGGWEVPAGEVAGRTWTPKYARSALERMPLWVRVWDHTPFIDRFAGAWRWPRGGYRVLPPGHPFFQEYGPEKYEAVSGISKEEYERQLLEIARDAFVHELDDGTVTVESVALEGEGLDTRIVVLFRLADRPGVLFGDDTKVWPSPHPDDYEGTPDWGSMLPMFLSSTISDPSVLAGEPDAEGIIWVRRSRQ